MFWAAETKKQLKNRLLLISFCLLAVINGVMAARQSALTEAGRPAPGRLMTEIYAEYVEDPARLEEYYDELVEYTKSQRKVQKAAEQSGEEFIETRQSIWTGGLYSDDISIIREMREFSRKVSGYPDEVAIYIKNAETNRREFLSAGYSEDSFECRNQVRAGELYARVRDSVVINPVYLNGWGDFYSFSLTGVFSALMAILIGAAVFITEKDSGMLTLVRTTEKGRVPTAVSKLLSAAALSAAATVILTAETFLVIAGTQGLNGGSEALQSLDAFRKSPLIISVAGYLPVYIGQRILSSLVFALATALLSVCFYSYVLTVASSAAFFGLNLALYSTLKGVVQKATGYINLYSLSEGTRLFSRYGAVNLFGAPVRFSVFVLILSALLSVLLFAAAVIVWSTGGTGVEIKAVSSAAAYLRSVAASLRVRLSQRRAGRVRRTRSASLFTAEAFKIWIASGMIPLVLILAVAGVFVFSDSDVFPGREGYTDKLYRLLITEYSGEWTEEKHEEISRKKEEMEQTISESATVTLQLEQGLITAEEYLEFNRKYSVAVRDIGAVSKTYDHSVYLKKRFEKDGIRGYFLDDTGWKAWYNAPVDYCLLAAIIILLTGIFTQEYGQKPVSAVMHASARGRGPTFAAKLAAAGASVFLLRSLSEGAKLVISGSRYALMHPEAPAISSEAFSDIDGGITLSGFFTAVFAFRIISALILGLVVFSLSGILRKPLPTVAVSASVTLLPAIAEYSGFAAAARADFLRLFDSRIVTSSIGAEDAPDLRLAALVFLAAAAAAALLAVACGERFRRRS